MTHHFSMYEQINQCSYQADLYTELFGDSTFKLGKDDLKEDEIREHSRLLDPDRRLLP